MIYRKLKYPKRASHVGFTMLKEKEKGLGFETPLNLLRA